MAHKILFVDDDPNARQLVSYALIAEGYEVISASSGTEALTAVASERPDLIILDVMMPDMSGLEVCEKIRANPATTRLPILMLSARGQVADRIAGLKCGADDYLPKPADTGELVARTEALLARANYAAPPTARVLAFLGAKGGVGTTTVAVNVGSLIARQGKSVCLVELRPSIGSAPLLLNIHPAHHLGELWEKPCAEISQRDIQARMLAHSSGLRILADSQVADIPCEISSEIAEILIKHLARMVDYVLLDLPPIWSAANRAAITQAHLTAVVCEPDPTTVECVKATMVTLTNWGVTGNLVGVIAVNRGGNAGPLTMPALRSAAQANVIGVMPPAPDAVRIAANEGVPLALLQPQHVASTALKELADRLVGFP